MLPALGISPAHFDLFHRFGLSGLTSDKPAIKICSATHQGFNWVWRLWRNPNILSQFILDFSQP
jgi:hypothetical protein